MLVWFCFGVMYCCLVVRRFDFPFVLMVCMGLYGVFDFGALVVCFVGCWRFHWFVWFDFVRLWFVGLGLLCCFVLVVFGLGFVCWLVNWFGGIVVGFGGFGLC